MGFLFDTSQLLSTLNFYKTYLNLMFVGRKG